MNDLSEEESEQMRASEHFGGQDVLEETSGVHIPIEIYEGCESDAAAAAAAAAAARRYYDTTTCLRAHIAMKLDSKKLFLRSTSTPFLTYPPPSTSSNYLAFYSSLPPFSLSIITIIIIAFPFVSSPTSSVLLGRAEICLCCAALSLSLSSSMADPPSPILLPTTVYFRMRSS